MATCNKCQQRRGLKSERGRRMDGQMEGDVLEERLLIRWCHFFGVSRAARLVCRLSGGFSVGSLTDSTPRGQVTPAFSLRGGTKSDRCAGTFKTPTKEETNVAELRQEPATDVGINLDMNRISDHVSRLAQS